MTPLDTPSPAPPLPSLPPAPDSLRLSTSLMLAPVQPNGEPSNALPPGLSAAPTFNSLAHALRRRWVLGVPLALLASVLAVIAVFVALPPQYMTALRFQIKARPDSSIIWNQGGDDSSEFLLFKATQQAMVASPLVITKALKEPLPSGKEVRDLDIVRARGPAAVDWLEKGLKSDFLSGPEFMRVTLGGDDPEEVASLLNAVGRSYLQTKFDISRTGRDQLLTEYKDRKAKLEEEHRRLLDRLNQELTNRTDVKDQQAILRRQSEAGMELMRAKDRLSNLQTQRDAEQATIAGLQARIKLLPSTPVPPEKLDEALRTDAVGAGYYLNLQKITADIDYASTKLQPGRAAIEIRRLLDQAREVQRSLALRKEQIRPEIQAQYRDKLREEFKQSIAASEGKIDLLTAQEAPASKNVRELDAAARELEKGGNTKPIPVQVLESKIENSKAALDEITRNITKFEFEAPRSRVTLLQEATPPSQKDYSRQIKLAGGGGLAAFALVLFAVSFFEFRSRKISDPEEVSQGLRINVVGALPAIPERVRRPLLANDDLRGQVWNTQLNEAVDSVRTLLLHASRTEALRVIMVTSADSGEGKTSLASQLAASLARAWRKTLLIDGDLRHPATHQLFDLPPEPGFSEVLRGEVQAVDAVRATSLSRLWVLPAGTWDYHALQALAQEDVRTLIEELKQQYDFIIVDSPPVLPVADSLLLGQHVDGVLFSILRDVSRAPAVYAAQQKLQPIGIRILGAVMVGAETDLGRGRYRYLTHSA
jgi:capsular exopolysaccharide synthesis family protein